MILYEKKSAMCDKLASATYHYQWEDVCTLSVNDVIGLSVLLLLVIFIIACIIFYIKL